MAKRRHNNVGVLPYINIIYILLTFEYLQDGKVEVYIDKDAIIIDTDDKELERFLLNADDSQSFYLQRGKNFVYPCVITAGDKSYKIQLEYVQNYLKMGYITIKPGGEKYSPLLCIFIAFFLCI